MEVAGESCRVPRSPRADRVCADNNTNCTYDIFRPAECFGRLAKSDTVVYASQVSVRYVPCSLIVRSLRRQCLAQGNKHFTVKVISDIALT